MSNEAGDATDEAVGKAAEDAAENAQQPEPPQVETAPGAPDTAEQTPTKDGVAEAGALETGRTRIEVPTEMSREAMKSLYDGAVSVIKENSLLKGRITQIGRDFVMVDIGYKSEGTIPVEEFRPSLDDYKVGDEIDVFLEKKEDSEGLVALSKVTGAT